MGIQREIDRTYKFIKRTEKFIDLITCEICYNGFKHCGFNCIHRICKSCYDKIDKCPFCLKYKEKSCI